MNQLTRLLSILALLSAPLITLGQYVNGAVRIASHSPIETPVRAVPINNGNQIVSGNLYDGDYQLPGGTFFESAHMQTQSFIAQVNQEGNVQWEHNLRATPYFFNYGSVTIYDMDVNEQHQSIIGGFYQHKLVVDELTLEVNDPSTRYYNQNGFIIKFDINGNPLWGVDIQGTNDSTQVIINNVYAAPDSTYLVTAGFTGTEVVCAGDTITQAYGRYLLLLEISDSGALLNYWTLEDVDNNAPQFAAYLSSFSKDSEGNIYGLILLEEGESFVDFSPVESGAYCFKLSTSNTIEWTRKTQKYSDRCLTIHNDIIYILGYTDATVASFNKNGTVIQSESVTSEGSVYSFSISKDAMGNIYVHLGLLHIQFQESTAVQLPGMQNIEITESQDCILKLDSDLNYMNHEHVYVGISEVSVGAGGEIACMGEYGYDNATIIGYDEMPEAINGSDLFYTRWSQMPLGLEDDPVVNEKTLLYPNPARGTVYLNLSEGWSYPVTVNVYDQTGRKVAIKQLTKASHGQHALQLPASEGIYLLRIADAAGNVATERVINALH